MQVLRFSAADGRSCYALFDFQLFLLGPWKRVHHKDVRTETRYGHMDAHFPHSSK